MILNRLKGAASSFHDPKSTNFHDDDDKFCRGVTPLLSLYSYCPYKLPCWGKDKLQLLPQQQSKAKNPKWVWYTEVNNPKKDVQILKAPPQGLFLEKIKYD